MTKITISAGFVVESIIPSSSFSIVSIRNIPDYLNTKEFVLSMASVFGKVNNMHIKNLVALIYFHENADAENAVDSLNDTTLPTHTTSTPLEVKLERELLGKKEILDSALKVSWFKPSCSALIVLKGNSGIWQLVTFIDGFMYKGRNARILVTVT